MLFDQHERRGVAVVVLNTVEQGQPYEAGDLWGCVGRWFAGRWHIPRGDTYAADVQHYLDERIWESSGFLNYQG